MSKILFVLIIVVVAIFILKNGVLAGNRNSNVTKPLTSKVTVLAPNEGEKFIQGAPNNIQWKGGYRAVAVGLATSDADTNHAIGWYDDNPPYSGPQKNGYTGNIIGFINTRENGGSYLPNSSTTWDGLKVCNFHLNWDPDLWCKDVTPGNYKIFVWSEGDGGQSMCIGSGIGPTGKYSSKEGNSIYGCNWDLSDQVFTITSP